MDPSRRADSVDDPTESLESLRREIERERAKLRTLQASSLELR